MEEFWWRMWSDSLQAPTVSEGRDSGKYGGFPVYGQEEGYACKVFLNRRKMALHRRTWFEQNLEGMVPQEEVERHFEQKLQ